MSCIHFFSHIKLIFTILSMFKHVRQRKECLCKKRDGETLSLIHYMWRLTQHNAQRCLKLKARCTSKKKEKGDNNSHQCQCNHGIHSFIHSSHSSVYLFIFGFMRQEYFCGALTDLKLKRSICLLSSERCASPHLAQVLWS